MPRKLGNVELIFSDKLLDTAITALKALAAANFDGPYPRPYAEYPQLDSSFIPFALPPVLVTPELIEDDGSVETEESTVQVKKEEWPEYYLRLFGDDVGIMFLYLNILLTFHGQVTPDPNTPAGYAVRTDLCAIIDIFEVNRKECARLLLEYPKWTLPGTFKPRQGAPPSDQAPVAGKDWQLESTILEVCLVLNVEAQSESHYQVVLGASFVLPASAHKQIYYIGLISEVCKLAPTTGGPAVGKSIRRLYSNLSDGQDVEISRRFCEWFATHMSNFNFGWVWKEWYLHQLLLAMPADLLSLRIPDLDLSVQHPKRNFIRKALELEIRLSYYDRILKTIPEDFHPPDAHSVPKEAPGPNFEYDDPGMLISDEIENDTESSVAAPHHEAAQALLNLFRGRARAEDIIAHLETLRTTLETESSDTDRVFNVDSVMRSIAIQCLLHIGSRSFSHLLNAIERYLSYLRYLASGCTTESAGAGIPEAKTDILNAAADFWKQDSLMINIVLDKLMQYQIVDPADVVAWTFSRAAETEGGFRTPSTMSSYDWMLMSAALDKANGRVTAARRKLAVLKKEDDDNRARATAGDMDVDEDVKPGNIVYAMSKTRTNALTTPDPSPAESPAVAAGLKALTSLTKEQRNTLSRTLEGFVTCLASSADSAVAPEAQAILTEKSWHNRASWGRDEWNIWETWGWYRHFCRAVSLRPLERQLLELRRMFFPAVLTVLEKLLDDAIDSCIRTSGRIGGACK